MTLDLSFNTRGMRWTRTDRRTVLRGSAGAVATAVGSTPVTGERSSGPSIYVGSDAGAVYAIDTESGDLEWTFREPQGEVFSSPTVVDGVVYFGNRSPEPTVYAVDAETGDREWSFDRVPGSISSSPTIVDDVLFIGAKGSREGEWEDGTLLAINTDAGTEEWRFEPTTMDFHSSPAYSNGMVYVGSYGTTANDYDDAALLAVDASSGREEWAFREPSGEILSSPAVADETVYIGSLDGSVYAVDAETGEKRWEYPTGQPVAASPVVVDDVLFLSTKDINALDAQSGEREWHFSSERIRLSSPTVMRDTVYVADIVPRGGVNVGRILVALEKETGDVQWSLDFDDGPAYSMPTAYEDRVYAADFDAVYAIDVETETVEWSFSDVDGDIRSAPTVVADPSSGSSVGSRVRLGTLGHHDRTDEHSDGGESGPWLWLLGGGVILTLLYYVLQSNDGSTTDE